MNLPEIQPASKKLYARPVHTPLKQSVQPVPAIPQPQHWKKEIELLEGIFNSIELPTNAIKLNDCTTIHDCATFINAHMQMIKRNDGNEYFLPYLERLQTFAKILVQMETTRSNNL
jgi:hypothetical protein